jgi:electron transport complex protein RnfD
MNRLFKVSSFPHIYGRRDVKAIMRDVLISLLPAVAAGIYFYKMQALYMFLVSAVAGVLSEVIWNRLIKGKFFIEDCSSVITSILVVLIMPNFVPMWLPAAGTVFAVVVVKMLFGGLGQNFVNPAATAKVLIIASWAALLINPADTVSAASGEASAWTPTIKDIIVGYANGNIGEASILALVIGGLYLIIRGVIDWRSSASYLVSVALFSLVIGRDGFMSGDAAAGLLSGSTFIVGIFMVNDFASTPMNIPGKIVFGLLCALVTVIFKVVGNNSDGAYYAVLVSNLFMPMIEYFTTPKLKEEAV